MRSVTLKSLKILFLLISIAGSLVLVEIFLKFFKPCDFRMPPQAQTGDAWKELLHRRSSIPGLSYELTPGMDKFGQNMHVKTNSYGMRDDEPLMKTEGRISRIVVLGDSFTFGFGVSVEEAYPAVLEKLLSAKAEEKGYHLDVLNMGVGGYSTCDEVAVLKYKGLSWNPKIVIIGYCLNDPETDPVQPLHSYFAPVKWWQYFNITRHLARLAVQWEIKQAGNGDYFRYLHYSKKWDSVVASFKEIAMMTQKSGIPVILLVFPYTPAETWNEYPYIDMHARVMEAARASGFQGVDFHAVLSKYDPATLRVSASDHHFNREGHRIVAETLRDVILATYPDVLFPSNP